MIPKTIRLSIGNGMRTSSGIIMHKLVVGLIAGILGIASVYAQVSTAELSGTVLDPSGAAVTNAKVTAIAVATNQPHETVTSSSGNYVLTLLPPGDYRLQVEAPGFKKLEQTGISLQINQQSQINLTLQIGDVSQVAQVTGQAPLLETES